MKPDINTATAEQLAQIPLITPARAESIVEWREQHGHIENMSELAQVPGVGHRTVEKMTEMFTVGSGTQSDEPEEGEGEAEEEGEDGGEEGEDGGEGEGEGEDDDAEEDDDDGEDDGDEEPEAA